MNRFLKVITATALVFGAGQGAGTAAFADGLSGSYLAARHASYYSDYEAASQYFTRALALDPTNPVLQESAVATYAGLGSFDQAIPIARVMQDGGIDSQIAHMVLFAGLLHDENYQGAIDAHRDGLSVGPLVDGLMLSWAQVGEGRMTEALAGFDEVVNGRGTRDFGLYHQALALALVGDYESADAIFSGEAGGPLQATRRGIIAHVQILSQLERNTDALDLLNAVFGSDADAEARALRAQLQAGETLPFTVVNSPRDGLAEVFHSVAAVLEQDSAPSYTILYSRIASYLRDDFVEALLTTAGLLEEMERHALATGVYDSVPRSHWAFAIAEMGRADALEASGREDAAIEVLNQLAESHPDLASAHSTLGDTLRQLERFEEAVEAYDRAVALFDTEEQSQWIVYYTRGIALERIDRWSDAEADLRRALELSPGQPFVLNYLGYSLVEQQINLDEALEMIEEAVAARPDDGYITDSLGWVLYRLGRYEEAALLMERSAELTPVDPVINDHLGDVYWAVGRIREARFQWRRAMSFDPAEVDLIRIRRKLEIGLDAVLEEEGADPLLIADES